jgi:putative hydrolase of HD superfamily
MKSVPEVVNFLFEVGILSRTPRSGFHFLGTGDQSVAEHICRTVFIGYTLASLEKKVDVAKVMKMCLLHDLGEARTSDLNYVHQMYASKMERKAISDLAETLPFGGDIESVIEEFERRKSKESLVAKDADNLEWILSLKEQMDVGNARAGEWIIPAVKRLKTSVAKKISRQLLKTNSSDWWFGGKSNDEWWISRDKKKSRIAWNKK